MLEELKQVLDPPLRMATNHPSQEQRQRAKRPTVLLPRTEKQMKRRLQMEKPRAVVKH